MALFQSIILDVDGTLVDSNAAHAHAWTRALKENGYAMPFEAGVAVIALRCGGWHDDDLRYDDPADFLAHYDESPLVQRRESGESR